MIERTFQDIPEGKLSEADQQSFLIQLGWSRGMAWQDLLRSRRVLMISEAGAGKTYECREQRKRLWDAGEPAFFIEMATLATGDLRTMLGSDEEGRLDTWLSSQSDIATFFLDSIDELKLTRGSFELALKRLKKGIGDQLGRARIVITTRPTVFDERLMHEVLPVPPAPTTVSNEEAFAKIAMGDRQTRQVDEKDNDNPDWRTVALIPLSDEQIAEFAQDQGVEDPAALLNDLRNRNAQEFARRPQDLIELCADWRGCKRLRTHRDQVAANVRVKLLPRDGRFEPAELSVDKAIEGASRLALAMMVMRRMTIRHSAASDDMEDGPALDPATILSDWNPDERKALLERPLFGFASYGRVRFHHRAVAEYLAAERLRTKRELGMSIRALKRLLFVQTEGRTIVRPSKRPVAGWLALSEDSIFEMLRDNEPAVLLNEGDPDSLSPTRRNQALCAYVEHYGQGGWRGLNVPQVQIHRFASSELADEIVQLWGRGIENPDVREVLLRLIEAGCLHKCTDIAYSVARNIEASVAERMIAIDALVTNDDPRLKGIAADVAAAGVLWIDDQIARSTIFRLFPQYISVKQLCQVLDRVKEKTFGGDLSWNLPYLISTAELDRQNLEMLRDGLVELLSAGFHWHTEISCLVCDRPHLSGALAATCVLGLDGRKTDDWFRAAVLALRLHDPQSVNDRPHKQLRAILAKLTADENERLFWVEDSLVQSVRPTETAWERLLEVVFHHGCVELQPGRDLGWINNGLGDTARPIDDRALLLEAAVHLAPSSEDRKTHLSGLKPLVADQPTLIAIIDNYLKPPKYDKQYRNWEKKETERKKQRERRRAKIRAQLIQFRREVAERPDDVFSSERCRGTAWTLWRIMSQDDENGQASGWNRRLIEAHFGIETADRLRRALITIWRAECLTLPSERPDNARNTLLIRWRFGLAGLYAEAEDLSWAIKLTEEEAKLAARFTLIELSRFPLWLENLVDAHPCAVDEILGNELGWDLNRKPLANRHSMLLQNIMYASEPVAKLFLPRLCEWLVNNGDAKGLDGDLAGFSECLHRVIDVILDHGDEGMHDLVRTMASRHLQDSLPEELSYVWLPALMRVDASLGVSALEDRTRSVVPAAQSEAVKWLSVLFGDHRNAVNLKTPDFSPQLLLRLLRLAYNHVRTADDAHHEGSYSPDTRDQAETARNAIVSALLDAKGEEGRAAKLKLAEDPLCAHFKHRILAVAEERWAEGVDSVAFDEEQARALDREGEAPASTNEAMFAILNDRLADLDDLLLTDASPKGVWALIGDEKTMRRAIARELGRMANGLYTVDQEAVTAEEKETDIRLRSVASDHEAVIEIKRADCRSGRDLRDTIDAQLITKYMAAESRKSGCLLITLTKDRKWVHPDTDARIDLEGLMALLREEAERMVKAKNGSIAISVHLLDLRPRLPRKRCGGGTRLSA